MGLEGRKCSLAIGVPLETQRFPTKDLVEGFSYGCIVLNKATVIVGNTEKFLELLSIRWGWVISNSLQLRGIW